MTLTEFTSALKYVKDGEIYPEIPKDITLTIAPTSLNDSVTLRNRTTFLPNS
jgi:hypothetical protein